MTKSANSKLIRLPQNGLFLHPLTFRTSMGFLLLMVLDGLEDADENEAIDAIESFLRLGPKDRLAASPYVYKNCLRIADVADDEDLGCRIDSDAEVWSHVRANGGVRVPTV